MISIKLDSEKTFRLLFHRCLTYVTGIPLIKQSLFMSMRQETFGDEPISSYHD